MEELKKIKKIYGEKFMQMCRTLFPTLLETEGKYKEFKDFRKRVLNPAIEEINGYTDLQIKMTTLKSGKTISHLHFKIDEKLGYQMTIDMVMNRNERLK